MKKNTKALIPAILVLLLANVVFAKAAVVLHELQEPGFLAVDDNQLYIVESPGIYIYSLKGFKFKNKFGKAGSGPGEFDTAVPISVDISTGNIIVNSTGKVSFFSKEGVFKKELKVNNVGRTFFQPLKGGYAAEDVAFVNNYAFAAVHLFDARLNKVKEIFRYDIPAVRNGKIDLLHQSALFSIYENKLFIAAMKALTIKVFDHTGQHLYSIQYPKEYKNRRFTAADEKGFRGFLRLKLGEEYQQTKDSLAFPEYWPAAAGFMVTDKKVYVITWKRKAGRTEFVIFDRKGKLLKQAYFPFALRGPLTVYPWTIKKAKLYQLIKERDTGKWQIHVTGLGL